MIRGAYYIRMLMYLPVQTIEAEHAAHVAPMGLIKEHDKSLLKT